MMKPQKVEVVLNSDEEVPPGDQCAVVWAPQHLFRPEFWSSEPGFSLIMMSISDRHPEGTMDLGRARAGWKGDMPVERLSAVEGHWPTLAVGEVLLLIVRNDGETKARFESTLDGTGI